MLEMSEKEIKYDMKSEYDIVTEADLKAEEIIISQIRKDFPEHSIFSEEKGKDTKESEYCWIVDPLDGTINFSRGLDDYCVAIAVEYKKDLVLGIVYQPHSDRLYIAEKGKGAFLNNRRISVSDEPEMVNMMLAIDNSTKMDIRKRNLQLLSRINNEVRQIRMFGSGSFTLARLAAGQLDIFYRAGPLHYWDAAPGILLVKEAGGMVTDFQGNNISRNSQTFLASNGKKHQEILQLIGQQERKF